MDNKLHRYRHWIQAAFTAVTNGYAAGFAKGGIFQGSTKALCVPGLNCYSCPGALGACPIGSLQAVLDSRDFRVSCYVFGVMMAFGTLLGRFICGFLCPFGLVQDLLHKIPVPGKRKSLPGHRYLKYLKYVVLVVFVLVLPSIPTKPGGGGDPWFCKYICPSGTLMGGVPLLTLNETLRQAAGALFGWKLAVLLLIVVLSVWTYRPFCKYLCPLGAFYGLFNPVSLYGFTIDTNKCVRCGKCRTACKMDVSVFETPNSAECIRCGDCRAVCPTNAILTKTAAARAAKKQDGVAQ